MGRFIFLEEKNGMPEEKFVVARSARICEGETILIRHNYFPTHVNSGSDIHIMI